MTHLLVTNDFPPKVGGIQSYLFELWRRLPPDDFAVLTTPHDDAEEFDRAQAFRIERTKERVLLPTPRLRRRIDQLADEIGAQLVVLDPALPLGAIGPRLALPYGVLVHGAEVAVPGRVPIARQVLRQVFRGARLVVGNSDYPIDLATRIARRPLPGHTVYPGVDAARFRPLDAVERDKARARFGLPVEGRVVVGLSRLVPRKGFDVLIEAAAKLAPARPDLLVAIAGQGRDRQRLEKLAQRAGAPVQFLGVVEDADLADLYGCADVFAMLARNRWFGVEQEGFGIVFIEAAAACVPQLAGASGGVPEAVVDGVTGVVVDRPGNAGVVAVSLAKLLDDRELRARMGAAARARAVTQFDRDVVAARLAAALAPWS
jgi:phosphatidylinositol alpha-1,6-mannosyltransferase